MLLIITKRKKSPTDPTINCRTKSECPLNDNYLQTNILYQATLMSKGKSTGITEGP